MSFIAGPYTLTYNSQSLGIIEDAAALEFLNSMQPIVGDNYGDVIQDAVVRNGNMYLDFVLQEYNVAGARAAFWPYSSTFGIMGQSGVLLSSYSQALVLTAVAGTSASSAPASLTFTNCVLAPGHNLRLLFGSRLRNVPLRMLALPYVSTSARFFS